MNAPGDQHGIPLFPLHTVLFPQGLLPLRIFEPRYVDMVGACLREDGAFGVVPILHGQEAGPTPSFHPHGTLARIEQWDQGSDGLLHLVARGTQRFDVRNHVVQADGLVVADIALRAEPAVVPAESAAGSLLGQLFTARPEFAPPRPWALDQPAWVAYRWAELLALPTTDRLALLTLDDGGAMLTRVQAHLPHSGDAQGGSPVH